jgi:hypothetical protein
VANKETGLEVNAEKAKYMVMSHQNAGRSHGINIDSSVARVEEFKYLGSTLTNQNSIQEEIESRLQSGDACCQSVFCVLCEVCYIKVLKLRYTELIFTVIFVWVCNSVPPIKGTWSEGV